MNLGLQGGIGLVGKFEMFRGAWVTQLRKVDLTCVDCILAWSVVGSLAVYICTK